MDQRQCLTLDKAVAFNEYMSAFQIPGTECQLTLNVFEVLCLDRGAENGCATQYRVDRDLIESVKRFP